MLKKQIKIKFLKKYKMIINLKFILTQNFVLITFLNKLYKLNTLLKNLKILTFYSIKKTVFSNLLKKSQQFLKYNMLGNTFLITFENKNKLDIFFKNISNLSKLQFYVKGVQFENNILTSKSIQSFQNFTINKLNYSLIYFFYRFYIWIKFSFLFFLYVFYFQQFNLKH